MLAKVATGSDWNVLVKVNTAAWEFRAYSNDVYQRSSLDAVQLRGCLSLDQRLLPPCSLRADSWFLFSLHDCLILEFTRAWRLTMGLIWQCYEVQIPRGCTGALGLMKTLCFIIRQTSDLSTPHALLSHTVRACTRFGKASQFYPRGKSYDICIAVTLTTT